MKVTETHIKGCFLIEPTVFTDDRGYFMESFNEQKFNEITGTQTHFVQDNQSQSTFGVIRGLHQQVGEAAQAKLVRAIQGKVLDVVVDARKGSPTYGQSVAVELSAENKKQLFVPRGCLHGFSVLSPTAVFFYKCDNYYNKEAEAGIHPLDPTLKIDWKIEKENQILSEKDQNAPFFK